MANSVRGAASGYSKVSLGLAGLLIGLCTVGQSPTVFGFFSITPGNIIPPLVHIQTLLSGGFLETNPITLVVDLAAIALAGNLFEPLWGTRKYLEFVVIVNFFACLITAISFICLYIATQDLTVLFLNFNGFWCVLAGYLVAFKQVNPQRKFALAGVSVDCRLGPVILLSAATGLWLGGVLGAAVPMMAFHGIWVSWTYLRFYQTRDDVQGDPGEGFTFADLFPNNMQPAVITFGTHLYRIAVACRIVPDKPLVFDLSQDNIVKTALPGNTLSDADRRRQAAERDLEKRLAGNTKPPKAGGDHVAVSVDTTGEASDPAPAAAAGASEAE
jgi:hypothetical protein